MVPSFKFTLNNTILPGCVTVGRYDGRHPTLTCGTTGGKVLMHNPHKANVNSNTYGEKQNTSNEDKVTFLNINNQITAVACGTIDPKLDNKDVLCVGTRTNLLAYNVNDNTDLFYKEVQDGIDSLLCGKVDSAPDAPTLALVGGNCSVHGFSASGQEEFWTVCGDHAYALAIADVNGDGKPELLVGSDDYEIRHFKGEEVLNEFTETSRIRGLEALTGQLYGYSLDNGTVGVYKDCTRIWRVKSRNKATALKAFDLDGDGVKELCTGWSNGKFEVRRDTDGKVVYKDTLSDTVSGMVAANYRVNDNADMPVQDVEGQIIVCSQDGHVRGYSPHDGSQGALMMEEKKGDAVVEDLLQEKQELLMKLKGLQGNVRQIKSGDTGHAVISPNTSLETELRINDEQSCLDLILKTVTKSGESKSESSNNNSVVRCAAVYSMDGGVFEGESYVVHPKNASSSLVIQLRPHKDIATELEIHALVGARGNNEQFHVFKLPHKLPKFAMFAPSKNPVERPKSNCVFYLKKQVTLIGSWLAKQITMPHEEKASLRNVHNNIVLELNSLRTGLPLVVLVDEHKNGNVKVQIMCDDMGIVGDLIQDMGHSMQISNLESTAEFPVEMDRLKHVLDNVENFKQLRQQMTAEMADNSHLVKTLVIRSEDARILCDYGRMKKTYNSLYGLNSDLIREYSKRANNHAHLMENLKDLNSVIQKAAKLRIGKPSTKVVAACRKAVKKNNIRALLQIISTGEAPGR